MGEKKRQWRCFSFCPSSICVFKCHSHFHRTWKTFVYRWGFHFKIKAFFVCSSMNDICGKAVLRWSYNLENLRLFMKFLFSFTKVDSRQDSDLSETFRMFLKARVKFEFGFHNILQPPKETKFIFGYLNIHPMRKFSLKNNIKRYFHLETFSLPISTLWSSQTPWTHISVHILKTWNPHHHSNEQIISVFIHKQGTASEKDKKVCWKTCALNFLSPLFIRSISHQSLKHEREKARWVFSYFMENSLSRTYIFFMVYEASLWNIFSSLQTIYGCFERYFYSSIFKAE